MFAGGAALPSRFDPLAWHIHEMLFGFAMAAIAGFLLTAIPNWTGRPPVAARRWRCSAGLWVLGRIACLLSALMPAWCCVSSTWRFRRAGRGGGARDRRRPQLAQPADDRAARRPRRANLLMHLEAAGLSVPAGLGWRLGLAAVLVLISVVAGRIVPSFTRNWLAKRAGDGAAGRSRPDRSGGARSAARRIVAWVALPDAAPVGLLLLAGARLQLWRLLRWRGSATIAEPLLLILHVGYGWLVLGLRAARVCRCSTLTFRAAPRSTR